ncbi:hypothetical protein STEG23_007117 [Scotinomys teguina]
MLSIEKASKIPKSFLTFPTRPQVSQHPDASQASLALVFATRIPRFRPQGRIGKDTGTGLDMYVVFSSTPPLLYVVHAGDSERPLNKLTRTDTAAVWLRLVGGWCAAGASNHTHCSG